MRKLNFASFLYPACIVLLLLSNGLLLWRQSHVSPSSNGRGVDTTAVKQLMGKPFFDAEGRKYYFEGTPEKYIVLFVFTSGDCSSCLEELSELNRVAHGNGSFAVYGLMSYASPDEMKQTQKNFNLSFPLLQDPRGEVLETLKLPKTPWKIVVNVERDQVVYEDMPSVTSAEREAFISRLGLLAGGS